MPGQIFWGLVILQSKVQDPDSLSAHPNIHVQMPGRCTRAEPMHEVHKARVYGTIFKNVTTQLLSAFVALPPRVGAVM